MSFTFTLTVKDFLILLNNPFKLVDTELFTMNIEKNWTQEWVTDCRFSHRLEK
jgi:hypothetical protein